MGEWGLFLGFTGLGQFMLVIDGEEVSRKSPLRWMGWDDGSWMKRNGMAGIHDIMDTNSDEI